MPLNQPEESIWYSQHGESLKSRKTKKLPMQFVVFSFITVFDALQQCDDRALECIYNTYQLFLWWRNE
jgi:hypothetical protein